MNGNDMRLFYVMRVRNDRGNDLSYFVSQISGHNNATGSFEGNPHVSFIGINPTIIEVSMETEKEISSEWEFGLVKTLISSRLVVFDNLPYLFVFMRNGNVIKFTKFLESLLKSRIERVRLTNDVFHGLALSDYFTDAIQITYTNFTEAVRAITLSGSDVLNSQFVNKLQEEHKIKDMTFVSPVASRVKITESCRVSLSNSPKVEDVIKLAENIGEILYLHELRGDIHNE